MTHLGNGARFVDKTIVVFIGRIQVGSKNFDGGRTFDERVLRSVHAT